MDTMKTVTDTVNSINYQQIIALQERIQNQVNSDHTAFISVLIGFSVLLMGLTWAWDKYGIDKLIKKRVEEEIERSEDDINNKINKIVEKKTIEYENKFKYIELDFLQSFAFSLSESNYHDQAVLRRLKAAIIAIELEQDEFARSLVELVINDIKSIKEKTIYRLSEFIDMVNILPDLLINERNQILDLIKDFSERK